MFLFDPGYPIFRLFKLSLAPISFFEVLWDLGRVQTESKSKIEMITNKALIGLCSKHIPLRFTGSEKMNELQPNAKIKK